MPRGVLIFSKIEDKHNHKMRYKSHTVKNTFYYQRLKIKIYTIYTNKVCCLENIKQYIKCRETVRLLSQ